MEILPVQLNLTFRERDKFCETEPLCITIKSVSVFSLVQPQTKVCHSFLVTVENLHFKNGKIYTLAKAQLSCILEMPSSYKSFENL